VAVAGRGAGGGRAGCGVLAGRGPGRGRGNWAGGQRRGGGGGGVLPCPAAAAGVERVWRCHGPSSWWWRQWGGAGRASEGLDRTAGRLHVMASRARGSAGRVSREDQGAGPDLGVLDDEVAALELARRAEASDVGNGLLDRLELAIDDLATAYPGTAPDELLVRVRVHLGYVGQLMDARATLAQHRRLLVTGGWLSLLAATCLIDLHRDSAAAAHLRCLETQAWQVLTAGNYRRAAEVAQAAQRVAPRDGSAFIQATAQEGRAWARLGAAVESRAALARVERLVSPLPVPDRRVPGTLRQ
jgi:hypothetical protein